MKQVVRIIGGRHRGKKIAFPEALGLRPTPSRIRETLFNWLMHPIRGARCLDAFAGSGALGFEAWSRGATQVTFIESSHASFLSLKKQAHAFDDATLNIIEGDVLAYLNSTSSQFDIVFLDAPFDAPHLLDNSIMLLEKNNLLAKHGFVYTESSQPITPPEQHWETLKAKKAGLVYYALHQKRAL
jgi:16S rRNA (guanine966-N2)-methyltransferase